MLEYIDFYDIAEYLNNVNRNVFSAREVAENAYIYMCDFKWSKEQNKIAHTIYELLDLLKEDESEECKYWVEQIIDEINFEEEEITKEMAKEFYRDLCGTVYGDSNKNSGGVMSEPLIAEYMRISIEDAENFCAAMIKYGITEKQNGMIVV